MMKNLFKTIVFVLLITPVHSMASDMGPGAAGKHMKSDQARHMMSNEMMRNMTQVMKQMQLMTRDMTHMMERSGAMDQHRMRDMARMMEQMSQHMHNMSEHMNEGKMDPDMANKMKQNMEKIQQMMKDMPQKP